MNKKKILYVTTSRADYWIIRNLLFQLNDSINLEILISGMHLSKKFGCTKKEVLKDFPKSKILKVNANKNKTKYDVLNIMNLLQKKFTSHIKKNHFDFLMLLGDRSEILPFAICASILSIPIIHFHGGETTKGAYDDFVRNSITMMANLHLTSTNTHKNKVINMGMKNVYNVGSLGCYNFYQKSLYYKKTQKKQNTPYFVIIFHPETIDNRLDNVDIILNSIEYFKDKYNFVFIGCNNDVGGTYYNNKYKEYCKKNNFMFYESLNNDDYFKLLINSIGVIGNSSSLLIEIPSLNIPILNIGNRQEGRDRAKTILNCECKKEKIIQNINRILKIKKIRHDNPYFNKKSLQLCKEIIIDFVNREK